MTDALAKARRFETLLRADTDAVDDPTGEAAALRIERGATTYWCWPDPHAFEGWHGRVVAGDHVEELTLSTEAVAHHLEHGEGERVRRIEVPAADPQVYQRESEPVAARGDPDV